MMDKKSLRASIRSLKAQMSFEERSKQSRRICEAVMAHPRWQQAQTVLLYHALPDEVDTLLLLQSGKQILLPVVVGSELELRAYDANRLTEGIYRGILEPTSSSPLVTDYTSIDLAIVPGMAFDPLGHRLGRGKGYYDRLLVQCPSLYKIGICFDYQLVETVPSEQHDIVMDTVISG